MPTTPADQPRRLTARPATTAPERRRPGWTEIVVGIAVFFALAFGFATLVTPDRVGTVGAGIFMTALSFIAAGGGFAAAVLVRIRSLRAFAVRRTTPRWLLLGLAGGLVAFVLKFPLTSAFVALGGNTGSPQEGWNAAATTSVGTIVLGFLFLGVLTPIGEELLFRGVVATALLRYGPVIGVVGSAAVFAVIHFDPIVILSAVVVGLIAGELRRRSDSVWPGVLVHVTFNLLGNVLAYVLLPALAAG